MNLKRTLIVAPVCIAFGITIFIAGRDHVSRNGAEQVGPGQAQALSTTLATDPALESSVRQNVIGSAERAAELGNPETSGVRSASRTLVQGEQLCRVVTGVVYGAGATPLEGAHIQSVTVKQMHHGNVAKLVQEGAALSPIDQVMTGENGSFRILNPRAGNLAIEITHSDHVSLLRTVYVPSRGPTVDIGRLELQAGIRLVGLVEDLDGQPIGNASVHLIQQLAEPGVIYSGSFSEPELARTDLDGSFETRVIELGPWDVRVSAEEYPPATFSGISVLEDTSPLHFVLKKGLWIRGQVKAADTIRLKGMRVELKTTAIQRARHGTLSRPWNEVEFRFAACDEDGQFALGPLPSELAGELFDLAVTLNGSQEPTVGQPQGVPDGDAVSIRLEEPCYVEFGAFDAHTQQPVQNLVVRTGMRLVDNDRFLGRGRTIPEPLEDGRYRVRLKVDSRFTRDLSIAPAGYAIYDSAEITPRPGQILNLGDLQFEPHALDRVLVLDALTNLPIADAKVQLISSGPSESSPSSWPERVHATEGLFYLGGNTVRGRTDEMGRALLTRNQSVAYHLVVTHRAYAGQTPLPVPIASPPSEFEVRLDQGASLRIQVSNHGQPSNEVYLRQVLDDVDPSKLALLKAAGMRMNRSGVTSDDGVALFERLPPGVYRFEVDVPKRGSFSVEVGESILYNHHVEF